MHSVSGRKLGIIQMIPEINKTTCLSPVTTFRAPIDATAMHRRIHLVSWQDQLFLVQQKMGSPSIFEVWEVDFETNQFNRLLNLDGFIIFLSGRFSAATSSWLPQEKNRSISQRAVITTLYMPFSLANKA
uniref:Putative ovule protein n=1 Tax=Solanum chacoense TaxID=4108 RepID=A0A0V0GTJ5_SOLCH